LLRGTLELQECFEAPLVPQQAVALEVQANAKSVAIDTSLQIAATSLFRSTLKPLLSLGKFIFAPNHQANLVQQPANAIVIDAPVHITEPCFIHSMLGQRQSFSGLIQSQQDKRYQV
jgi:hypothetical protein